MSEQCDPTTGAGGLSRRGFLKGIGVSTAATGIITAVKPIAEAAADDKGLKGPGEIPVTLKVNGQTKKLNVEPRVTLLDALRNRLDVTGPKKVCDRATCGACGAYARFRLISPECVRCRKCDNEWRLIDND